MTSPKKLPPDSAVVAVLNERASIEQIEVSVLSAAERHGYEKASRFAVKLAIGEALANAFRHGHVRLPPEVPVTVEYSVGPKEIKVRVQDKGPGFDPSTIPDPTLDENLENPTGRGIMLIRAYMTSVAFNDKGNRVEMIYRKPEGSA
jgi:serine/threonine-protein kinase RsbW